MLEFTKLWVGLRRDTMPTMVLHPWCCNVEDWFCKLHLFKGRLFSAVCESHPSDFCVCLLKRQGNRQVFRLVWCYI